MKIVSNGFRVTDICPQIDKIEVNGEGLIKVIFPAAQKTASAQSSYMNIDEFSTFVEAAKTALDRAIEESGAMG